MRRSSRLLIPVLVGGLALPAGARKPSPSARAAFEAGRRHYDAGNYERAAVLFKRAYELEPAPLLLFNIAQAYRLQKDYLHAVAVYGTYLRVRPNAPNRSDVEALIVRSSSRLDENGCRPAAPPEPPRPVAPPPPVAIIAPSPPKSAPPPRRRAELIAGLTLLGVGAAGLATGGYFAARQSADADRIAGLRADHGAWDPALYDDGVASAAAANALFVTGAAVAVTGGVLTLLGARKSLKARSVSVAPTAHGAAAMWSCEF